MLSVAGLVPVHDIGLTNATVDDSSLPLFTDADVLLSDVLDAHTDTVAAVQMGPSGEMPAALLLPDATQLAEST